MMDRSNTPWTTVLSKELRGLEYARRWTIATGMTVIVLGLLIAVVSWSRAAEAASSSLLNPLDRDTVFVSGSNSSSFVYPSHHVGTSDP